MATDYFKMMQDVVGGYGEGVGIARDRQYQDEKRAREKVIQGREDETYNRAQTKIKAEDEAVRQYGLLETQGVQNKANIQANDVDFDMAVEATGRGLPMPAANPQMPEWNKATDLDKNRGMQGIMRAKENWDGVVALQGKEKDLAWDEGYGTLLKSYTGAEDQIGQGVQGVNNGSGRLTLGDRAKDGSLPIAIVKPDGRATFLTLPHNQQAQFYAASGMIGQNPTKALAIMAGLNKDLAAAFAADNDLTKAYADLLDKQAGRDETRRHNRVSEGNDAARTAIARGVANRGAPKEIDPKYVTELNRLSQLAADEPDPVKRREIDRQYQRVEGLAATSIGKIMGLREQGVQNPKPEISNADLMSFADKFAGQPSSYKDAKGQAMPVGALTPVQLREEATRFFSRDGNTGGGSALDQAIAATQKGGVKPPTAPPVRAPLGKVLSEAAPRRGMLGLGAEEAVYNIQMPDGTTQMVSAEDMKALGYPMESMAGRTRYSPDYK